MPAKKVTPKKPAITPAKAKAKSPPKPVSKAEPKEVKKATAKAAPEKVTPSALSAKVSSKMSLKPAAEKAEKAEKKATKKQPPQQEETIAEESGSADWLELQKQFKGAKAVPYALTEDFPAKSVISHKVLGIGFVIKNVNNRIDVVFKDGQKTLITNYKK